MSFLGGGYGGPTRFDDEDGLPGDDGTFDSPLTWITLGIVLPLVLIVAAVAAVVAGSIWLPDDDRIGQGIWLRGPAVTITAAMALVGVALILIARYFLPNVFRSSYSYQYYAIVGIALCAVGIVGFVIAALMT
jgi:uncharacterized membrane protein